MKLYIVQQHSITVHRTVFWVCVFLVLIVIRCSCYYLLDLILFHHDYHHDSCDYQWNFYCHSLLFEIHLRLSVTKYFWLCKCATTCIFPPLDIPLEYWIEHIPTPLCHVHIPYWDILEIFYRGVPGFTTDCPCGVWWRGLTTCLLYVGPLFGNLV